MEYIIASSVAIFIATLIVYKVANNLFRLGLRIKPLLLCAVCAMFISLVLPKIVVGFAGLPGTLAVLAIFSVVFAYFVARCDNEPSSQQKFDTEAESACCQAEPLIQPEITAKMMTQEEPNQDDSLAVTSVIDIEADVAEPVSKGSTVESIGLSEDLIVEQSLRDRHENEEDAEVLPQSFEVTAGEEVVVPDDGALSPEQLSLQEAAKSESDSQVVVPVIESDFNELDEPVITGSIPENIDLSEELIVEQQPLMDNHENGEDAEVSPQISDVTVGENVSMPADGALSPEQLFLQEAAKSKSDSQVVAVSESDFDLEETNSIMESNKPVDLSQLESEKLDDLLDFAFLNKESQNYEIAFNAFYKALKLYPNSEAAPFLVVEIGNILKNKGDYDGAIKVFGDGRNLSQTKQDEMMEQEFICTIAYLRIIKNVLLQNSLANIPFFKIPPQIVKQIDEEFREWRSVGNI
ncbi:hypothetical protein SOV_24980 [Sporomusa ovata DSM 2662]|uniref:Uncharacterized protein n=1 Tax=Sporomusa ovata TaxID=2378 RepID=A0A0U1L5D1_9FIRM|nr:hypothetical protein [Sporomusa ovata]EQB25810.1 hypothetical protein SOV_4c04770 [Sporomusa ovata DSM 2662]CQR74373.1 hypothetical protein SpAn4DRAFT_0835 [Sporomusa ovata]